MKSIKNYLLPKSVLVFVLFFSLAFVSCKKTSEEGSTGSASETTTGGLSTEDNGKPVSFSFALPSLIRQLNLSPAESERFTPDQILRGSLYVVNTDDSTNETFDWTVYLDESDYSAQSNKTIILDPGNYEFSLLLTSGTRQYAGNAVQSIINGENDVSMTIRPVIGDTVTDVTIIDRIFDLRFQYDTAEFTNIPTPQLGVLIDSDPTENLLTIDPATGLTNTYVSLAPGTHTLKLKFYDGSTQLGRSIPAQESVSIALGNTYTMDIVALQGETIFTLTEDGGDATFKFNIPAEVIEETGGLSNLEALFTISSEENGPNQVPLTLTPSGENYFAETTLTDYQYDIVDLMLTFTQLADGKQIGECLNENIILDVNTESVACNITLRRDGIIGGNLLATLGINVMGMDGIPVAGATIYANGEMIGITGTGSFGTPGYVRAFLVTGNYTIRAEDENSAKYGEESVNLTPIGIENLEIELDYLSLLSINNDDERTNSSTVTLNLEAEHEAGIVAYFALENLSTPSIDDPGWISLTQVVHYTGDITFTLSGNSGEKTVYVWYKDANDGISSRASDSIIADLTPFDPVVLINGGEATSNSSVILSLSANDDFGVTGYYLSESNVTPSASAPEWVTVASSQPFVTDVSFSLSSGDGNKTIYVWFQDDFGNLSSQANDSILLDSTPPSNSSVVISNGESTSSRLLTLSLSSNDESEVIAYFVSETSVIPDPNDQNWNTVVPKNAFSEEVSYALTSNGTGLKTVYVWFKDSLENISTVVSDSITLNSIVTGYTAPNTYSYTVPENVGTAPLR